jgi:hypothetical protein
MATTLNAGTTTATALNLITDTTGAMAIQTSGTTAIAISNAQVVSLTNPLLPTSGGTGISSLGTGVATFLGTPTSANLAAALTDETGTGANVFAGSPTLTGTPVAPTATVGTNTTQIATTAFVLANAPASPIPAGSAMLFQQTAAPTGWTKVTTYNDYAIRIVSGTASTGGSSAFSTCFTNQTPTITVSGLSAGATTLSTAQMPSHSHSYSLAGGGSTTPVGFCSTFLTSISESTTGSQGSGGSHTHSISGSASSSAVTLAVQYVDHIIATKN